MKDKKLWIIISAVSGFTAVAIGAFGAHSLREHLSTEMLEVYKTGVLYQFIHTIILLILSITDFIKSKIARIFFLTGIILFSFSLYIYSNKSISLRLFNCSKFKVDFFGRENTSKESFINHRFNVYKKIHPF